MTDVTRKQMVLLLPRLRRFCLGLAGTRDRADDLAQATCERALSRLDQWKAGTRLDSWMFTIAKNLWINEWHRRQTRGTEVDLDGVASEQSVDAEKAAETSIMLQKVLAHMARLPDDQRQLLMLVCVEGFSYREAAECLDIQIGTVMSRLARARKKIKELVAEAGDGPAMTADGAIDGGRDHA